MASKKKTKTIRVPGYHVKSHTRKIKVKKKKG